MLLISGKRQAVRRCERGKVRDEIGRQRGEPVVAPKNIAGIGIEPLSELSAERKRRNARAATATIPDRQFTTTCGVF